MKKKVLLILLAVFLMLPNLTACHKHTFGEWVITKEATCVESGLREHTCTECGKVVKKAYEDLENHGYVEEIVTEATCKQVRF